MPYRRLGRTGLKVSVLSFGSWVTFGTQVDTGAAPGLPGRPPVTQGVNFFDNAEAYAGGESERIMGEAIAELGWPRWSYVISTKVFWGIHDGAEHAQHAQPQVPAAGDRRLARAARPRLRRPPLLPPRRPETRRSRRRCGRCPTSSPAGKALYWGTSEWTRRRDPRRVGDRRAPPPAQAGGGAAAVQPARTAERVEQRVRPALRRHRPRPHDVEPARVGPADRQVPRRRPRRQPRRAARLRVAAPGRSPTTTRTRRCASLQAIADELGCSPWRSSPSRGARRTRTCRR